MIERTETPERIRVIEADAIEALRRFPDDYFHASILDPPYGLSEPPDLAEVLAQWLAVGDYSWPKKGGGFMGAQWDRFVPGPVLFREVYRTTKPGGILLAFAATRTDHFMGTSIELAGFRKIDGISWLNGQGWPKGGDLGKAIDRQRHDRDQILACTAWIRARCAELGLKAGDLDRMCGTAGMGGHWISKASQPYVPTRQQWDKLEPVLGAMPAELEAMRLIIDAREPGEDFKRREVVRVRRAAEPRDGVATEFFGKAGGEVVDSLPATDESARWTGWSPTLKPANEPIGVYRKPPRGTIVANLRQYGTGAFHVEACRIGDHKDVPGSNGEAETVDDMDYGSRTPQADDRSGMDPDIGRWPPDVMLTHSPECDPTACVEWCPVALLDAQSGIRKSGAMRKSSRGAADDARARAGGFAGTPEDDGLIVASEGGASRFFWVGPHAEEADLDGFKYAAKAHPSDRDDGLPGDIRNTHPTVKPLPVARWLARLVGTDDGVILDCFSGSGTTARACLLEGFACVAIERDPEYAELSRLRAGLAPTEAIEWIRLRDRLREATVPRKRSAKARPTRPPSPGVALIKAWGAEGRAACVAWLDATEGDARVAPVPSHMSEWSDSFTPPAGHPIGVPAPAPARATTPARAGVIAELREAHAVEDLLGGALAAAGPGEITIAAVEAYLPTPPHPDAIGDFPERLPEISTDIAPDGADLFAAPEPTPPAAVPPAKPRRKRRDEGLRAAVLAATTVGDPEGPDGATLRQDGPGREAEVLAAAAFGPGPSELDAARARGEAALRALPPMVARSREQRADAVETAARAVDVAEDVLDVPPGRPVDGVPRADAAPDEHAVAGDLPGPGVIGELAVNDDLRGGGVHGEIKITEPAAPVKPPPAIFIAPAEVDPWDDLPPMFAAAPRRA